MPNEISIMMPKANGVLSNGRGTFMPKKLETMVGMDSTIVTEVRNFITMLTLFEMTDAKASIILLRISL